MNVSCSAKEGFKFEKVASKLMLKSFMRLTPGAYPIKHFWKKLTDSFCKLDHFIAVNS
jgi:hypothetical protein